VEAMTARKRQSALVLMLLAASMLALYPTLTLEKPQSALGGVQINAEGQAFPIGKGNGKPASTASSASLTLSGSANVEGNEEYKLNGLTGSLQVGSASYSITGGKGEINNKGKIEINAKTGDGNRKLELVLHGNIQGESVFFNQRESKLSSLYFLDLAGQATFDISTTSTSETETEEETVTVTVTQNNTLTETVTQIQENTVTTTETSNQTLTETVTASVTETATETVANSTATVTETVTQTVANSTATITETMTTTVANVTLTTTVTVANTTETVTVTNATQTLT